MGRPFLLSISVFVFSFLHCLSVFWFHAAVSFRPHVNIPCCVIYRIVEIRSCTHHCRCRQSHKFLRSLSSSWSSSPVVRLDGTTRWSVEGFSVPPRRRRSSVDSHTRLTGTQIPVRLMSSVVDLLLVCLPHFPQIDIIGAMVIVWRVRGKIIRSVLCNIVCNSCAQCNAHTYEQT